MLLDQILIFPFVNSPEDFPWPRYSNARKPNFFLNAAGKDSNQSIGNIIIKSSEVLKKIKPDALFILGDTNSGLSSIAAKKLKIPIKKISTN